MHVAKVCYPPIFLGSLLWPMHVAIPITGPGDHEEGNFGHRFGPFLWQQGLPSDDSFKWGIQLGEPTAQVKSPKRKL